MSKYTPGCQAADAWRKTRRAVDKHITCQPRLTAVIEDATGTVIAGAQVRRSLWVKAQHIEHVAEIEAGGVNLNLNRAGLWGWVFTPACTRR